MELISVIVPVYNVEKYLDRCVDSLVNQVYKNLEIILVDDGSPDNCPTMCDAWAQKDSRIKVIHKENGGLSDARNAGMAMVTGEYIAFVDSDDWVDLNLLHTLLTALKKSNSDIACCKIVKVREDEKKSQVGNCLGEYKLYDTESAMYELITDKDIQQIVWNKLYKRKVLGNIKFKKGKYNEDEFWTYQVVGNANQIVVVDYPGYYYLQRNSSIMGSAYSLKRLDAIDAKVYRQEYLANNFPSLECIGKKNLLYTCLYHGQLVLKYINADEKKAALIRLRKVFKQYKFKYNELRKMPLKDKVWIGLGMVNLDLTCKLRNMFKIGC